MPTWDHIVVVMQENHRYDQIIGNTQAPWLNAMAVGGANFTQSYGITHPSQPNYIALFSGSQNGSTSDDNIDIGNVPNLYTQMVTAGKSFVGYSEGLPYSGYNLYNTSPDNGWRRKHCPWLSFSNIPTSVSQPYSAFPTNFDSLPALSFVIPNQNNDMHDGTVAAADAWMQSNMDTYLAWAKTHNSLLIVAWDENDYSTSDGNHTPLIMGGAKVKPGNYGQNVDLYGLLAFFEDSLGLPRLGSAAGKSQLTTMFASGASAVSPLTRSGSSLRASGANIRLSGANAYWVGLDDNAGGVTTPSHTTITSAFQGMKTMGVNLVRAHTVGISAGLSSSFETAAGVYNDANLDAADWAVYQAGLQGIYLVVPLTDNWNYYHGGKGVFVNWAVQAGGSGAPTALPSPTHLFDGNGAEKDATAERQFFYNANVIALFKDYISHWLNHVNPYTGLAYKDDPTIAIVETGNELYYAAQTTENPGWTQDIASYVKGIAPAKLLMDGSGADRQAVSTQKGLTAAAIDIVGAHYYPQIQSGSYPAANFNDTGTGYAAGTAIQQLAADATAATNAGKAFIVGEYPWTRSDVGSFYSAIESNASIDGDMFWSFIAGTETHGGSFGSDDFPVHYPYAAGQEATYAPALATHIRTLTATFPGRLRVLNAKGSVATPATIVGRLRVLNAKGVAVANAAAGKLRILNAKGVAGAAPSGRLRILKASGIATQTLAVAQMDSQALKAFDTGRVVASAGSGSPTPTSYTYALVPNADVHTLDIKSDGSFIAPGRLNGCIVTIAVTAHLNGASSPPTNVDFVIEPHNDFIWKNGRWIAISRPQTLSAL